jgi:hypothetical protein
LREIEQFQAVARGSDGQRRHELAQIRAGREASTSEQSVRIVRYPEARDDDAPGGSM